MVNRILKITTLFKEHTSIASVSVAKRVVKLPSNKYYYILIYRALNKFGFYFKIVHSYQIDSMKKVYTSHQIKSKVKQHGPAIESNYIPDDQVALYIKCLCVKKNL